MEVVSTTAPISVDDYLRTTYDPDCDYVDGEVIERNVGERDHGELQFGLAYLFRNRRRIWKTMHSSNSAYKSPGPVFVSRMCASTSAENLRIKSLGLRLSSALRSCRPRIAWREFRTASTTQVRRRLRLGYRSGQPSSLDLHGRWKPGNQGWSAEDRRSLIDGRSQGDFRRH